MTVLHGGWAIVAVTVPVVGLLLVLRRTRRSPGDRPAEAPAPPAMDRLPDGPPMPTSMFPEPSLPLERRHPLPPVDAFSLAEPTGGWSLDGARHRAVDPPAPSMLSNRALLAGRVLGPDGSPVS